jgi:hypothetical protein
MRQFKWAVAAAATTTVLLPALWVQPLAVAQTVGKPPGSWCPVGGVPPPSCKGLDKPKCIQRAPVRCGHVPKCLKWTCREFNPQTREPFKGPKPLPWSRLR